VSTVYLLNCRAVPRAVPRAGPDGPRPEAPKLEGRQIKKILHNKLLLIIIIGFIWCPSGIKEEEMSIKKISLRGKKKLGAAI